MRRRSTGRTFLASIVTVAVAATVAGVHAVPAQADPPDGPTSEVINGLDDMFDLLQTVSTVGRFAETLPTLALAPGGESGIGLADLLTQARTDVLGGNYGGASTLNELVAAIDSAEGTLSDGTDRHVDFSATRTVDDDVSTITIGFTATREVDTGLEVASTSPQFSFTAADGVEVDLTLTGSLVVVHDESDHTFRIQHSAVSPSLSLTASSSLPTPADVTAGVGILGVRLAGTSTYNLSATLASTFEDPNNDGYLSFVEPGPIPGELAAGGAGAGLAGIEMTAGSLSATLNLEAIESDYIDLPGVNASVTVSSPDLLTTAPQVSYAAGALDSINAFLNLSPRDLAAGLAEIATTIVALQRSGGANLPFLRGDLADAIKASESLVEFLAENVDPTDDPDTPGRPHFASLQELLELLADANALPSTADFTITNGSFTNNKVRFDLGITRAAGTAQPLNKTGEETTGGGAAVTYSPTELVDTSKNFSDEDGEALSLVGRQVTAGASAGIILAADGNKLTLSPAPFEDNNNATPVPSTLWLGGEPVDGTPYTISAGDPRLGLVELGNVLSGAGAIANANAKVAVAEVTPSYSITIPVVLDLRPGSTADCDPGPAVAACPFELHNPSTGVSTVITSLPLAPDRIMLRTGTDLLTADAPISTEVDVDATVGFVGVKITGVLRMCTEGAPVDCSAPAPSTNHLLSLGLVAAGDADNDITLPALIDRLRRTVDDDDADDQPELALSDVITGGVAGRAYAELTVDVPGANGFFGGSPATATVTLPDITDLSTAVVSAPDLAKLVPLNFDPANPLALFGVLLADLQALQNLLHALPGGSAALDTQIPLVGKSLSELIGSGASGQGGGVSYGADSLTDTAQGFNDSFVGRKVTVGTSSAMILDASDDGTTLTVTPWNSEPADGAAYQVEDELQGVLNLLSQQPSASLQELLDTLKKGLGAGSDVSFTVDTSGADPVLRLDVNWERSAVKELPINLSFDLGGTDRSLVGVDGTGTIKATAGGGITLGLQIPLTAAAAADPLSHLKINPDSEIEAGVSIEDQNDLRLSANLGPFQVAIGNPDTNEDPGTQLRAALGVSLSDTTHTSPVTLSEFAGALELTMNNEPVTCSSAPTTSTPLALCAYLPTYLNGAPINADPQLNAFVVRVPSDEDNLTDMFSLNGNLSDGTPRFVAPTGLADAFANAALDLLTLGDGLFAYLEFLENALQVASFDGKLPLIGKDLQAGSDFLADIRTNLEGAFAGAPTDTTAGAIKTFLNDQVRQHLPGAPNPLPIEFECNVFLTTPNAPTVTPDGDAAGPQASYEYAIVAFTNDPAEDGIPSAITSVQNNVTLNSTHKNTLSWDAVPYATGYKVLRRVAGAGNLLLVHETTDTEYVDDDPAPGEAYEDSDANPKVVPCPDDAPAESVTGFTVTVDLHKGNANSTTGCTDADCHTGEVPLDLGVPGLSFKATDSADDKIEAKIGWSLHLEFGLDREKGFFVRTQDTEQPEFTVGASVNLPADMQAQLAFFNIDISKLASHEDIPLLAGAFAIDLRDDDTAATNCHDSCSVDPSRMLTLDKLKGGSLSTFVDPRLSATVDIAWDVKATVDSALPGIGAEFLLKWKWNNGAPSVFDTDDNDTPDDPSDDTGLLALKFQNVTIDPGQFIGENLGPIVSQIISVFKPVQPVIDTILAPLPVLSDLSKLAGGDDVTIASLAQTFSTLAGGPDLEPFIEVLQTIRSLGQAFEGDCGGGASFCVNIGSFDLKKDLAMSTQNSAATAATLVGTKQEGSNPLDQLDAKTSKDVRGSEGPELPNAACANGKRGISFPALENPTSLFGLLLNQDVELACFDSGPLTLGFEMNLRLGPVYAPPPVYVVLSGGASVSMRIAAGFDTYGIRTAVEKGKLDATILDSIYFKTTDTSGAPLPVIQFKGFLAAGASVSAVIIEVGIKGGIELTVSFTWNDPNNDGKFRFNEFLATALSNPICLFNVGGQLDLFIQVFVTLGIDPFSVSFDFELVRVKLLDFTLKPDCAPPPPKLGGTDGGVLYLFAGKFGGEPERGHEAWDSHNTADETWIIRQVGDNLDTADDERKIVVQALGITEEFPDAGGNTITTVVFDGRGYDGKLKVLFNGGTADQPFDKRTIAFGGDNDDTIRAGSGESFIDGNAGNDNITTTDRPDLSEERSAAPSATVAGGTGNDSIFVGNAENFVHGDGTLVASEHSPSAQPLEGSAVTLTDAVNPSTVEMTGTPENEDLSDGGNGVDGNDTISAGLGGGDIWGGAGDDTIGTANDSSLADLPANAATADRFRAYPNEIVGGRGSDRIKSGSADDEIYTGARNAIGADGLGSGDDSDDENTADTGTGSDTVYGSNAIDYVVTNSKGSQSATVFGGDSDDVIIGGNGTDKLYGGPADDYVIAEPATVGAPNSTTDVLGPARTVTRLPLLGAPSAKELFGGGGTDRIYGGDGPALIYGDRDDFTCEPGTDPLSDPPTEAPTVSDPPNADVDDAPDLILGGNGVDTVNAGGGADHVFAKGGHDMLCGNADDDRIDAGADDDHVYAGTGSDIAYGDTGEDLMFGNDGDDSLYGNTGDDTIEGNNGTDTISGGAHDDLVVGGTREAARNDQGDYLYGDSGDDRIVGDNGTEGTVFDLDGLNAAYGGQDHIWGADQADHAFGGLDDDKIFGGDSTDYLEGNNATDHVYGEDGSDDIIGGSSQVATGGLSLNAVGRPDAGDFLYGGPSDDTIGGDNLEIGRVGEGAGELITRGRGLTMERTLRLLDLGYTPTAGTSGGDVISGGDATDVILGQGGVDTITGDGGDDYAEGGQAGDTIDGNDGQDDLVGGGHVVASGAGQGRDGQLDDGDTIRGGDEGDVGIGDNGQVLRDPSFVKSPTTQGRGIVERTIELYDLGDNPKPNTSGGDLMLGQDGTDVLYGQGDKDRVQGNAADDYAEGGPAADWIEGNDGDDDLVGGSSTILGDDTGVTATGQPDAGDVVFGGAGDDVETGDNAAVSRVAPFNPLTTRLSAPNVEVDKRALRLLDLQDGATELVEPAATRFGGDRLSGGSGVDVQLGQDGTDDLFGGSEDDYQEGNGAGDHLYGDRVLSDVIDLATVDVGYPGTRSDAVGLEGVQGPAGQDDQIGGSSRKAHRDSGDWIYGDGAADFELGDNGELLRTITAGAYLTYVDYNPTTVVRQPNRFDVGGPAGAFGADYFEGNDGDDYQWGQDGNDTMHGNAGNDDMYGELGGDTMFGETGQDAMVGDRGLITDKLFANDSAKVTADTMGPAFFKYEGLRVNQFDRRVDLLADGDGDMDGDGNLVEKPGLTFGGQDTMRGGPDHDTMHGAFEDDLMNGDSGGDWLFGADGADVMYGGKGKDVPFSDSTANDRTDPASPYFDSYVDYLIGGHSGADNLNNRFGVTGGADVLDYRPRGTYAQCAAVTKVTDTCSPGAWFLFTETHDDTLDASGNVVAGAENNQHHQGIDWIYGGQGRDILQGNVGKNGPDFGDRLQDWLGAFNLFTRCNASYGDDGDIRQHTPAVEQFLHTLAYGSGVGTSVQNVFDPSTSAHRELAYVYAGDKGNNGKAFPTTPGHFEQPACQP